MLYKMDTSVTRTVGASPEGVHLREKKNVLHLSVNVFSTKVLIGDTSFTSRTGDGTAILRGHPSHAKI